MACFGGFYCGSGGTNRLGYCGGIARSTREMRVVGNVSTWSASGEGNSAMADAQTGVTLTWTWNAAAAQSVAPTGSRTARTASTVDLFIVNESDEG